jgi:hypothetical protein
MIAHTWRLFVGCDVCVPQNLGINIMCHKSGYCMASYRTTVHMKCSRLYEDEFIQIISSDTTMHGFVTMQLTAVIR